MLFHRKRRRLIWLGVTILIVALGYGTLALTPWSIGPCNEDNGMQASSPDGKHVAKVFVRSCGATTGWQTHVNLRSRWGYFNPTWDGIIRQDEVFSIRCWKKLNLVWKDNAHLEINHAVCQPCDERGDSAAVEQSTWRGVKVTYQELPCDAQKETTR